MGKRKSARKPQGPKKREPLSTTFNCLFCNHENAVTCKLDKKAGIGTLSCKICGQQFQASINYLSHAVDVYSDWIDACDEIANPRPLKSGGVGGLERRGAARGSQSQGQSQARQSEYARDEADKGAGADDVGDVSDLEDFDDDDDEDMKLTRGGGGGGAKRQTVLSDEEEEDDDY